MSAEAADRQQQELRNFMSLLPLTLEIAGLPRADLGRPFNDGQLEVRCTALRNAYKLAKKVLRDVAKDAATTPP